VARAGGVSGQRAARAEACFSDLIGEVSTALIDAADKLAAEAVEA